MDLERTLAEKRARVEALLRGVLPDPAESPLSEPVAKAMRFAVEAGGKRLRPILVLAVADLFGKEEEKVRGLAVAVELVHTSSLILDDLPSMDDARVRRGRPALHRAFDEATAILAANGLLLLAFQSLAAGAVEARLRSQEIASLVVAAADTVGIGGMIGGEIADLRAMKPGADLKTVEFVHSRKTGRLFVLCLREAALACRAKQREVASLEAYARNLGLAFQVTDDLLDAEGTAETLGKDPKRDRGKTTFVDLCGAAEARRLARDLLGAAKAYLAPFRGRAEFFGAVADWVERRRA